MESYARGTKFACKLCKANIEKPLMRLNLKDQKSKRLKV
jgi:hypothetical protein